MYSFKTNGIIIVFLFAAVISFIDTRLVWGRQPYGFEEDKKIPASHKRPGSGKTEELSAQVSSFINQGMLNEAAKILKISSPQQAALILLSIKLENTREIINFVGKDDALSMLNTMADLNIGDTAKLFTKLAEINPSLAANLYNTLSEKPGRAKYIFKDSGADEITLNYLLNAKDKKHEYIISGESAIGLLRNYASANQKREWTSVEITALINSGRSAEILFNQLRQDSILKATDTEKIKVLLGMKADEAAEIIKNLHLDEAVRILINITPRQAALILAQKTITNKHLKEVISGIYRRDKNTCQNIIEDLKTLNPDKAKFLTAPAR